MLLLLGQAARYSEEYFATDLFVDTAGPDATFYASGNANVVTSNPVLSISGLQTAMTILGNMVLDGAIDPDLFDIFIRRQIWLIYAEHHLASEQMDAVDVAQLPGYTP
jgi:hypothetical protein